MKDKKWIITLILVVVCILLTTTISIAPTKPPTEDKDIEIVDNEPIDEVDEIDETEETKEKDEEKENKENREEKIDLNVYIPNTPETTIHYHETMDSGIAMELQDIEKTKDSTKYTFLTFIQDGLGHIGVKGEDRTYYTIYEVTNSEIKEIIKENKEDKGFVRTLLKAPLKKGNTWEGSFRNNNKEYKGQYEIIKIEDEKITVRFTANNVDGFYEGLYQEEYVLEKNKSIVSLTKAIPWKENGQIIKAPFDFSRKLYEINTKGVYRKPYNEKLDAYMPNEDNAKGIYYYHGIAEYAHIAELDFQRINKGGDVKVYNFKGKLEDGSGFENQEFNATYIIDNECIYEEIETRYEELEETTFWSKYNLNSYRNYPIILKAPLQIGNEWDDIVIINDVVYEAKTMITDISFNPYEGRNEITTVTAAKVSPELGYRNDTYVETRIFAKGIGLVSFIRSNPGIEIDGKIEYHDFGYGLSEIVNNK